MEDIIIRKKDIEKFGKKVMKEVYKYLNDGKDTCIFVNKNNIEEIKKETDEINKNLVKIYFDDIIKDYFKKILRIHDNYKDKFEKYKIDNDDENYKIDNDNLKKFFNLYFHNTNEKDKLNIIKDKIENESLDIDFIYQILNKINLETIKKYECILFLDLSSFLNIYSTYIIDYKKLKD